MKNNAHVFNGWTPQKTWMNKTPKRMRNDKEEMHTTFWRQRRKG